MNKIGDVFNKGEGEGGADDNEDEMWYDEK